MVEKRIFANLKVFDLSRKSLVYPSEVSTIVFVDYLYKCEILNIFEQILAIILELGNLILTVDKCPFFCQKMRLIGMTLFLSGTDKRNFSGPTYNVKRRQTRTQGIESVRLLMT